MLLYCDTPFACHITVLIPSFYSHLCAEAEYADGIVHVAFVMAIFTNLLYTANIILVLIDLKKSNCLLDISD